MSSAASDKVLFIYSRALIQSLDPHPCLPIKIIRLQKTR